MLPGLAIPALRTRFPLLWLRDACQCPRCVHPATRQKLLRLSDVPADARPVHLHLADAALHMGWSDGHASLHPLSLLARHASPARLAAFHRDTAPAPWSARPPGHLVPYAALARPAGLLAALTQLLRSGLLFVTGVPTTYADADADADETVRLAELFGEIRPTLYGRLWDVKSIVGSQNIAYTDLDLGLHADLLYFEHPPRFQILHCLRNRVAGGVSLFADGLHAAHALRAAHPDHFAVLSSTPVPFQYINDAHHLHHAHPTIELAPAAVPEPPVKHINYSPPFQAPLPLLRAPSLPRLHAALQRFAAVLDAPQSRIEYLLREGDAAVFDNRRVLHGRTAFRTLDGGDAGQPDRWLRGCYVEADSVLDRARVLRATLHPTPAPDPTL